MVFVILTLRVDWISSQFIASMTCCLLLLDLFEFKLSTVLFYPSQKSVVTHSIPTNTGICQSSSYSV